MTGVLHSAHHLLGSVYLFHHTDRHVEELVGGQGVDQVGRAVEDGPPDEGGEEDLVLIADRGEDWLPCQMKTVRAV